MNEAITILDENNPVAGGKSSQPEFRFPSATSAKSVIDQSDYHTLHQRDMDRMVWDAYDRLPPNDPEAMRKNGEEWCANVDWGDTQNAINERVEQDNNLVTQPMPYISAITEGQVGPRSLHAIQVTINEHYKMFRQSDFWTSEVQGMTLERTAVGLGIFHHHIPFSWHFRSIPRCNLIYPPRATSNMRDWPWMAVRSDLDITDLIALLDSPESSTSLGWKTDTIRHIISKLPNLPSGMEGFDWRRNPEAFVEGLRTDTLTIAAKNNQKIRMFHLYVREYDGRISESIVSDSPDCPDFLFQKKYDEDEYTSMADFVSILPLNVLRYMEKARGLGHQLLPYNALINDTYNRAVDSATLTSSLMLKDTEGANGMREITQLELGGRVTFIPEDMVLDQRTLGNPVGGLVSVMTMIKDLRETNNGGFGGTDHNNRRPEATATEMKLRYGEATKSTGFETDRLYDQLTQFYRSNWKRIEYFRQKGDDAPNVTGAQEAKDMWRRVREQGVTNEDLDVIKSVEANRLFGDGDPNQVFLAIQDLAGPISRMPLTAQRALDEMAVAARTRRPWMVQALYGNNDMQTDRVFSVQNWRIVQENGSFEASDLPIPIQDDDYHPLHVVSHTQYAESVVADFDNQVLPPTESLKRLVKARDHTALHMPLLQRDRSQEEVYATAAKSWQGIENKMVQMQQNIQDAQQAEQERQMEELRNPRLSVEEQEKVLTAQVQRAEIAQTAEFERQLKASTAQSEMQLKKQLATAEAQLKALQAATSVTPATQ